MIDLLQYIDELKKIKKLVEGQKSGLLQIIRVFTSKEKLQSFEMGKKSLKKTGIVKNN